MLKGFQEWLEKERLKAEENSKIVIRNLRIWNKIATKADIY